MPFRNWCDPFLPLESRNENLWEQFFTHLAGQAGKEEQGKATMAATLGVCGSLSGIVGING
jgi:hypothetical protein